MKVIKLLIFICLFNSCNTTTQQQDTKIPNAPKKNNMQPANVNCYRFANQDDTISLRIMQEGNKVTGVLVYKLKEKDKNEGTIQGSMNNDILVADYHFISEGTRSTRQVAFKLENNSFVEGFGETVSTDNKVSFKNIDSLTFTSHLKLIEISCL